MADGAEPSRLERVAEAVSASLADFRRRAFGEAEGRPSGCVDDLRAELGRLGETERLFIALAAVKALDLEHAVRLIDAICEDWDRALLDEAWEAAGKDKRRG